MKLALGTAQFGMDYGINNKRGKIPKKEAFEILEEALSNGIRPIDTAFEYGDSERVIGSFVRKKGKKLEAVSKLPKCSPKEAASFLEKSLERLNSKRLYGYLVHDFDSFANEPELWDEMKSFKEQGKARKIGFSLYYPGQAEMLLENGVDFGIVQLPYSVLDQRFSEVLPRLKEKGVEVHARSVFLQGLVFKRPEGLEGNFEGARESIAAIRRISAETGVPVSALCINFASLNNGISKVVVGVDSRQNLLENIAAFSYQNKVKKVLPELLGLGIGDEKVVVPSNWVVK